MTAFRHSFIGIVRQPGEWTTTSSSCWTSPLLWRGVMRCYAESRQIKW